MDCRRCREQKHIDPGRKVLIVLAMWHLLTEECTQCCVGHCGIMWCVRVCIGA